MKHSIRLALLFSLSLAFCACAPVPDEAVADEAPLIYEDGFLRQDIDVPTLRGVIHTEAVYAPGSRYSGARVVLMIPGTLANGAGYYSIDEEGYNAARVLADAGFIVALIDLPGSGESFRPPDGRVVDSDYAAWALARVRLAYAWRFGVTRFDVYGETGIGTSVALRVAREPWVRSVALSAVFYREFGPRAGALFDPGFRGFIESNAAGNGYAPQNPDLISGFFGAADPDVQAAALAACIGPAPYSMSIGAFDELFAIPFSVGSGPFGPLFILDHPIVDAAPARAPALLVQGSPDPIGSEAGTEELRAAYGSSGGGVATVVTLPGASHLMRFDSAISDGPASPFWDAVLTFYAAH